MFRSCPIRVLVAESDLSTMFDLRTRLSNLGYLVVAETTDGREALSLARELYPDLVVMDAELLNADGQEAGESIDRERLCPIVLLGECQSERVRDACSLTAVQAYLVWPVSERDLEPAIELALARFREVERLEWEMMGLRNILGTRSKLTPGAGSATTERSGATQEGQEQIGRGAIERAA